MPATEFRLTPSFETIQDVFRFQILHDGAKFWARSSRPETGIEVHDLPPFNWGAFREEVKGAEDVFFSKRSRYPIFSSLVEHCGFSDEVRKLWVRHQHLFKGEERPDLLASMLVCVRIRHYYE